MVKSLDLITHWLSWCPGSGQSVLIGKDEILGLGLNSFLLHELITSLRQRNIHYLYQARGADRLGASLSCGRRVESWDSQVFWLLNGECIAGL
jgi:hypothetical protein